MLKRKDILKRKDEILQWCSENIPISNMSVRLNCNVKTLRTYLKITGIDYKGQQGSTLFKKPKLVTYADVIKDGRIISRESLKKKLLREGLKEYKCESCGLTEWMGKQIPLELHHKDGNQGNINLDNLQLLCPNCHTLTDNYRGRGVKVKYFCEICGKPVSKTSKLCKKCAARKRCEKQKTSCPPKETLLELLKKKSILQIGKEYNVSDNTVRKWCKKYNLPYLKKEIKAYLSDMPS